LPKYGLSKTYCKPAKSFIERNSGSVNLSSQVTELICSEKIIEKVVTTEKVYDDFDFVISAIPHFALEKIIADESIIKNPGLSYSSILNIYIWLKGNPLKEKRATFIPSNNIINKRPLQQTAIKNLFLAGDWVDTGLPATIESAVKSGRQASELAIKFS
jgi:phytoene dehydrogenase-like protein